jgi:hypothetical protein
VNDRELLKYTTEFRESVLDGLDSKAMCFMVCAPLEGLLSMMGVETTLEDGAFADWNHVWLRLPDGRVLDPTADQFNEHLAEPLPAVYLGPATLIHSVQP